MKKIIFTLFLAVILSGNVFAATSTLKNALPLLQKTNRTAAENQQVLQLFRTSTDPDVIFASGASLVRLPPAKAQEPSLFNVILRSDDLLKKTFAAVIITAMGSAHDELTPLLQEAIKGKDPVLRAYAAAAYTIIEPQTDYTNDIVRLYIFDPAFAARALNVACGKEKTPFKYLKQASQSTDEQLRAAAAYWLGSLHTTAANKQLLKLAKKESSPDVQASLARALAENRQDTLSTLVSGLRKNHESAYANTCALALGFMTGNAVEPLRQALLSKNLQERINASRAAAYMANVLVNPETARYSSDRKFDIYLLKGLIAPLNVVANSTNDTEKLYAENALRQIEKLME